MKLKKLIFENFKGVKSLEIDFTSDRVHISGENGSGKTTTRTGFYWLFADVDSELNSKPNVRPNGADDGIVTTVTAVTDFNGKEVTFSKHQKVRTTTDKSGKTTTTKTNSYEVNGVPKSQRDAFKYLEECGFDTDKFLVLSHPDVFIRNLTDKKTRTAIREVLFGMTDDITDAEVAKKIGLIELSTKLLTYQRDEIVAMQNATKRKVKENYGTRGEVLNAKIDGLNSAKIEIDTAQYEALKDEYTAKIAELTKRRTDAMLANDGVREIADNIIAWGSDKREHLKKVNSFIRERNDANRKRRYELEDSIRSTERDIEVIKRNIIDANYVVERMKKAVEDEKIRYKEVKARKFTAEKLDKKSLVCPTCGRPFTEEQATEIKVKFEQKVSADKKAFDARKKADIEAVVAQGKHYAAQRDKAIADGKEYNDRIAQKQTELSKLREELASVPANEREIESDSYTQNCDENIAKLRKQAEEYDSAKATAEIDAELAEFRKHLDVVNQALAKAENNARIDKQIEDLQNKRIEYEQSLMDADKILADVKMLEMEKNRLLTEQINSHFALVRWVLFEVQANGEILTDRCTPYIDDMNVTDSANTGRVILGKLDIVNSLQKFYGQEYPIWLDNAECLTSNTSDRIAVDSQLITLSAVEGEGLTVE